MEELNNKIEQTLNSIDGLQKAEVTAFFHTRTHARLEKKLASTQDTWMPIRKPVWVIAILMLLLLANVFLLVSPSSKATTAINDNVESSSLQGFASSYGLSTSTEY